MPSLFQRAQLAEALKGEVNARGWTVTDLHEAASDYIDGEISRAGAWRMLTQPTIRRPEVLKAICGALDFPLSRALDILGITAWSEADTAPPAGILLEVFSAQWPSPHRAFMVYGVGALSRSWSEVEHWRVATPRPDDSS